ncbi:DUF2851 family protein [Myroides sp. M-43]|uniref:DUF2851 family protein n=1 Tax=Myroides oncorhynchi TaxID=2893756 RepID=UPI001E3F6349|nr:DUF2851 family protein [Myroides oncorhynchi]MCC9041733.1 DUF2851 family protein [Myroides oncorhynchi]
MKEAFLHYVWANQLFNTDELYTASNESLSIISAGTFTGLDGPDFFNARILIGTQEWAGNVEIHINGSDWYAHHHEVDQRYDSIILHVVWDNDTPVFRTDGKEVTVFILKNYVDADVFAKCNELFIRKPHFNCEKIISNVAPHIWTNWKEKLFLERLEEKIVPIQILLTATNNHWEHVFFCFLAKSFGLNANGEAFFNAVKNLPVLSIYIQSQSLLQIEALLFGITGLLSEEQEVEDSYVKELKREWIFLKHKYNIVEESATAIRFFQLRPPNFPTIRLAQLSSWLYHHQIPIHTILNCSDMSYFYTLFDVKVSEYWETHYVFNKVSKKQVKKVSREFIDLVVINVVLPIQVAYKQSVAIDDYDVSEVVDLGLKIKSEKNSIITLFEEYKVEVDNALDSQALVHLKKNYCDQGRCLECQIGKQYLKRT